MVARVVLVLSLLSGARLLAQDPTPLELAYAARLAYFQTWEDLHAFKMNPGPLADFELMEVFEDPWTDVKDPDHVGFRAIALRSQARRTVIIAYRGTEVSIRENVGVDAGMFFTIGGPAPQETAAQILGSFSAHYGGWTGVGGMVGALALRKADPAALEGLVETELQGMGFHRASRAHLEQLTRRSAELAVKFFKKIRNELMGKDPEGTRISKALIASGWMNAPEILRPGGYSIYTTGHSLGGFLAQVAAGNQGCNAVTFAAPGAQEFMRAHRMRLLPLAGFTVRNLVREHDVVSLLGTHVGLRVPLCDVYDSPAERPRIQAAREAERTAVIDRRARLLPAKMEDWRRDQEAYERAVAAYPAAMRRYEEQLAAFTKEQSGRWALSRLYNHVTARPAEPARPVPPALDPEGRVRAAEPDVYGPADGNFKEMAKIAYGGIAGYIYRNHTLDPIVEQLEVEAHVPHWPAPVGVPGLRFDPPHPVDERKDPLPAPAAP